MYGDEPEMLDGTQMAADWTFSGLQKFGQGLEERLKGLKLPSKLLKKVQPTFPPVQHFWTPHFLDQHRGDSWNPRSQEASF